MLICVFQGFSSGLPFYVWLQLVPAWLRSDGIDLSTISLLTAITFVYNLKFLWSPLLDRYRLPITVSVIIASLTNDHYTRWLTHDFYASRQCDCIINNVFTSFDQNYSTF